MTILEYSMVSLFMVSYIVLVIKSVFEEKFIDTFFYTVSLIFVIVLTLFLSGVEGRTDSGKSLPDTTQVTNRKEAMYE